ncbi:CHAT domain-containing protein [Lactarius sanguifluus]|nr:CHAT domain-containing protein [Lactarius sanguifluus]
MDPGFSTTDFLYDITSLQSSLSWLPRSHPAYIILVQRLATLRFARHESSQQREDLDKCIVHCTEAIFLPPVSRAGVSFNIVQLLFLLALALLERSDNYEQPHDIKYSIEYLRYLLGLPLDSFDLPRIPVVTSLIRALLIQVQSEAGDGTRNIKEMVILCRELLTSNVSASLFQVVASTICLLSGAVNIEYSRGRHIQSIDEVVECLRGAVNICPPGSHEVLLVLANTLYIRFIEAGSNDDYEEATVLLEIILDPNQPGGCPSSLRVIASSLAVALTHARSTIFQNPQYSEVTISRLRASLDSSSIAEELRLPFTECLAMEARKRFKQYNLAESLEEANSYASKVVDLSSSRGLERTGEPFPIPGAFMESHSTTRIAEKIRHLEDLLRITPPGTEHHRECLYDLADWYQSKFYRTSAISDIEESVKYSRLSADATRHSNGQTRANSITFLRNVLLLAFNKTSNTGYLDEIIAVSYDILELTSVYNTRGFQAFQSLVSFLIIRFKLSDRKEDLLEVLRLIPLGIDSQYALEPARFQLSCQWAFLARTISHPTTLTAYKTAISLMQKSLSFAPTVSIQHAHLVALRKDCQSMPLDYASFQIDFGRFEEAIEILEQGRALLWSEMRGFRTTLTQLTEEDLPLATRFTEINQELEALTISVTPSGRPEKEDGVAQGIDRTDPFGRLVVERQRLVEERDALILKIRGQLGFEGFLKAPSFTTLRTAASHGPVILINHCKWRSGILILFHKFLPCSIPTAKDFYDRASELRDVLVAARKHGLASWEYQDALSSVLRGLYELVGEPVIKRLRLLGVPEQSRIWWCPTSVFCSLPLHAMGPIPSRDTSDERYFSDLYIPSYTPSLSALIESRNASPQTLEKPSLLLVAQPDDSLPGVNGEIKVIQRALKARAVVTGLVSREATPSSVVEGLRNNHFAHFACHGVLETGKPFEASFQLHGDSRLTLLDIVRSRIPDAEFAFLACCHAAEITEDSIADEALHLTAAMQYCGFRSVVGTMWEMADTDGQDLAKIFYKSLFSSQDTSVPYYERSAEALRDATQKLRGKRGITLERWVNFVHYGA